MHTRYLEVSAQEIIKNQFIKECVLGGTLISNCYVNYYSDKRMRDEIKEGQEFLKELEDEQSN